MLSLLLLCLFANVSPSRGAALGRLLAAVRNDDKIYVHMPYYHVEFRTASGNNIAILRTGIYFYSEQAQNKQIHIITISHHTSNIISFPIDVAVMGRKQWVFVGAVSSTHALNWYSLLPDSAHAFLCGFVAAAFNWQRRCCCPLGMVPSNCTPLYARHCWTGSFIRTVRLSPSYEVNVNFGIFICRWHQTRISGHFNLASF